MKTLSLRLAIPHNTQILYDPEGGISKRVLLFLDSVANGGRCVLAIVGGYGMGKTHVLKHLEYVAENKGFKGIYVASPGRSFMDFYSAVLENLFDTLLDSVNEVGDPLLKHALQLLNELEKDLSVYVRSWLMGLSIPPTIKYKLGLIGRVEERNAIRFLSEILRIASQKYGAVLVLLDEVETLLNLSRNTRLVYAELLREFIDALPKACGLALSMTPACWDELSSINPALARRLSGGLLYLKPLKREHVRDFITLYFPYISNILSEDALDVIYDASNGVHGEVLRLASIVVEEAVVHETTRIGADEVRQVLAEYL